MTRARDLADSADKDIAGTLTLDAVNASGVITGLTVEATGDTAAGDNAAMGYTAAEGLILTGQGSTNDVTIKNDADADVIEIPTGTTNVTMAGTLGVTGVVTANAGVVVDEMTLDADTLTATDTFTIDAAADITLNADGGDIFLADGSTVFGELTNNSSADGNFDIKCPVSNADVRIKGNDNGTPVQSVLFDMSSAGSVTFNHDIKLADGGIAYFGTDLDLSIYHDGGGAYVANTTGILRLQGKSGENSISLNPDGSVELYHNNVKKFETTAVGHTTIGVAADGTPSVAVNMTGGATSAAFMHTTTELVTDLANSKHAIHLIGKENAQYNAGYIGYTHVGDHSTSNRCHLGLHSKDRMLAMNGAGQIKLGFHINADFGYQSLGLTVMNSGETTMVRDNASPVTVTRLSGDGGLIDFYRNTGLKGSISVSGDTVSYNAFSGSHWSRLSDNSKPTILKGTLIETIDEMCDWYGASFTVAAIPDTEGMDGEMSGGIAEHTMTRPISLPNGASVGDTISHTYDDITYDNAVIILEDDSKHPKCKISDTADSTRIYGVYAAWDNDDDTVNDMYVTAVGTHVVRVHGGQTVSAGDLLVSNGDGTAKVQDDDIIRSKTLGKALSNIKQETYADGSFTVPCALYCG